MIDRVSLPIDDVLPELRTILSRHRNVVVHAPPGAGKTTRVPLALVDEPWAAGQRIVMLEPRRVAARAAAQYMARMRNERLGDLVGVRTRTETFVGRRTRIEVITEGVLTRMIRHDPTLESVALVIFDEFHERSVHADLGLALTLHSQAQLREDLRIVVMSATLDILAVAALLGDAPIVSSNGRAFPIETRYRPPRHTMPVEAAVAAAVAHAVRTEDGDILAFLPGAGEIRRAEQMILAENLGPPVRVIALHGILSSDAQDAALREGAAGERRVVLATSIAETSITIEGIRVVIDSGVSRLPRFSPRTGMTSLETVRVSRASADQRRGRAGRVAPGICYRLWAEQEDHHLLAHAPPEILGADLAPIVMDLAAVGITDPTELRWLDPPPRAGFTQAGALLGELDALTPLGTLTAHGAQVADLPLHPRLAHLVIRGAELGHVSVACDLAALLSERDIISADGPPDPDLRLRLDLIGASRNTRPALPAGHSVHEEGLRRVRDAANRLRQAATHLSSVPGTPPRPSPAIADVPGLLVAFAYPDRIGQVRPGQHGHYLLRSGNGASIGDSDTLSQPPFLAAAIVDGRRPVGRAFLAAPLDGGDLRVHFAAQMVTARHIRWDDARDRVVATAQTRLGALVLDERPLSDIDPEAIRTALVGEVVRRGLGSLPWSDSAIQLRQRVAFLRIMNADAWPDFSDAGLNDRIDDWLSPRLHGIHRMEDIRRLDLHAALAPMLDWEQHRRLDELAPTHLTVPSGSRIPIDYANPRAPKVAVRIQELFGLDVTPAIDGGRMPLSLHLLSPAHRPVQVTRDLSGFWRTSYFDVRKEMKGRYPKHPWPDDPLAAPPTTRAKPRR